MATAMEEAPLPNFNSRSYNETSEDPTTTFIHISTAILSLTMITAFLGNIFLAFIIVHTTNRKMGPVQILILHTCLADIMFALCSVVPQLAKLLTSPMFFGNDLLCRVVSFVQIVPMYASSYLLVAISIDRYVAICKPIAARNWKYKRVYLLAGLAWFTSFLFGVPQIFFFRYDEHEKNCVSHFPDTVDSTLSTMEKWYIAWFLVSAWLIPSVIIGVLYTLLCCAVYRSDRSVHRLGAILLTTAGTTTTSSEDQWRNELRRCQPAAERSTRAKMLKTIKLTLTIVVCNFVLWSPFCLTNFITAVFPDAIGELFSFRQSSA